MMKGRSFILTIVFAVLGTLTFAFVLPEIRLSREVARESALKSLEQQLFDKMQEYRRVHGEPPKMLEELELDYSRTDGATSELLHCFRIEAMDDDYHLRRQPCVE